MDPESGSRYSSQSPVGALPLRQVMERQRLETLSLCPFEQFGFVEDPTFANFVRRDSFLSAHHL